MRLIEAGGLGSSGEIVEGNMDRDIEKDLIEIECAIKSQEEKDNMFTVSVLQRCHKLVSELKEYRELKERLNSVYGECDGILEVIVNHLEHHEGIDLPEPVFKARLLTDGEVDEWEAFKAVEEQGKLLKLPCAVGDTVYCIMTSVKGTKPTIFSQKFDYSMIDCFEKTVFLSREEAETALEAPN